MNSDRLYGERRRHQRWPATSCWSITANEGLQEEMREVVDARTPKTHVRGRARSCAPCTRAKGVSRETTWDPSCAEMVHAFLASYHTAQISPRPVLPCSSSYKLMGHFRGGGRRTTPNLHRASRLRAEPASNPQSLGKSRPTLRSCANIF